MTPDYSLLDGAPALLPGRFAKVDVFFIRERTRCRAGSGTNRGPGCDTAARDGGASGTRCRAESGAGKAAFRWRAPARRQRECESAGG